MRLPRALLLNAALALVVVGGGVWAYTSFNSAEAASTAGSGTRTVAVSQGTVTATVSASGSLQSASTASATFETSGTVTEIRVKVGDKVAKGAVLATVDDTDATRQLASAEAGLEAAEDALDRATDSDSDTSEAEAQVEQAEQEVEEAEDAVAGTVLKAPMAGTVTAVNGTVGSSSGGSSGSSGGSSTGSSTEDSSGFVEIADLSKMEISASVGEADATKLKVGQDATVTWNALADTTATAKLAAIDPNASSSDNVVTYPVTFTLTALPDGAKAGQSVEVTVVIGEAANVVMVTSAAVTTVGDRHTVTVLENGQQVTRTVEIGLEGDQATEVTSGLAAGEQVVLPTTSTDSNSTTGGFPGGGGIPGGGGPGGGLTGGGNRAPQGGGR